MVLPSTTLSSSAVCFRLRPLRFVEISFLVFLLTYVAVMPLAFLVIGSFMRRYGFFNIPSPFTLTHWHHMLTDPIFLVALKNSLIIASAAAIGGILLYFALAYLLVSRRTVTAPHEAPS